MGKSTNDPCVQAAPKIWETASVSHFPFVHTVKIVQSNKHESWTPQIVPRVCTREPTQSAMVKGKACHAAMGEMEIPQTLKGRVGMRNLGTPIYIQSLKLTARIWKRCNFEGKIMFNPFFQVVYTFDRVKNCIASKALQITRFQPSYGSIGVDRPIGPAIHPLLAPINTHHIKPSSSSYLYIWKKGSIVT